MKRFTRKYSVNSSSKLFTHVFFVLLFAVCSQQVIAQREITPTAPVEYEFYQADAYSHLYKSDTVFGDLALGASFYNEKTGVLSVFGWKQKQKEAFIVRYDPLTRKVLEQKKFTSLGFMQLIKLSGLAISPNGRYLLMDRGGNKNKYSMYDLENEILLFDDRKKEATSGPVFHIQSNGVAFINDTEYYVVETGFRGMSKEVEATLVKRRLPSNELVESRPITKAENFRVLYGKTKIRVAGICGIAYNPTSPWGVPVLAVQNRFNLFIYNEPTGELIKTIRLPQYNVFPMRFALNKFLVWGHSIIDLESEEIQPGAFPMGGVLAESSLEVYGAFAKQISKKEWKVGLYSFDMPKQIKEEIAYKNWLKAATAKKDSLLNIVATVKPQFEMNSPDGDWIYLGTQGVDGKAFGMGNAVRKDGVRFIKNGFFENGNFVIGKMENVYDVSMEGEFKDMKLNGFGRHVTENGAILEGEFVSGVLEGQGETIDPSGLTYVGQFKQGTFNGKGKITRPDGEMFDGEFQNGKPHGNGIYKNGSTIERVEYYEGQRIDQAYQMKVQADRMERQQKMAELQAKQKQAYLAEQQKKKSSNKLFGALAMGVGAGVVGSSAGMDAMKSMEFGTAMFQDVMSGGTSNLNNLSSQWQAEFNASKPTYSEEAPAYTQKKNENKCDLATIYEGPDGGQGGGYCVQATLMKCHGKMDRVAQLCKLFKQVTDETCPVCN